MEDLKRAERERIDRQLWMEQEEGKETLRHRVTEEVEALNREAGLLWEGQAMTSTSDIDDWVVVANIGSTICLDNVSSSL